MAFSKNVALVISSVLVASSSYAEQFAGNATPTQYLLTISKIEFHKSGDPDSVYTTYANGTGDYDIAAVDPGINVGVLAATGSISPGTYDKIRFTVSKTMSIKASSNGTLSNGVTCRTTSTPTVLTNPLGNGTVAQAYLGVTDGGTAQLETVTVPSGSNVEASEDFADLGTSFRGTMPITFTVGSAVPTVKINFNVTNSVMFVPFGPSQCAVFPGPPTVTVTVT